MLYLLCGAQAYGAAPSPLRLVDRPGATRLYRLDYHNVATSDLQPIFKEIGDAASSQPPPSLKRSVEAAIRGEVRIVTLSRDTEQSLVRYQLRNGTVRLSVDGRQADHEVAVIRSSLAAGIVVSRSLQGQIRGVWLPPGLGLTPQGVIKTLLALTQVVLPREDEVPATPWETVEEEQDGRFRIAYTPLKRESQPGNPAMVVFAKEKRQHLPDEAPRLSSRQRLPVTYLPSGAMLVVFDGKQGAVREIQGSESTTIRMGTQSVGTSTTTFSMVLQHSSRLSRAATARLLQAHAGRSGHVPPKPLWLAPTNDENDVLLYRQKLGTDTLESLLEQLGTAEGGAAAGEVDETELYLKLKALVFLNPGAPPALRAVAAKSGTGSRAMKLIVGALASTGSPAAQEALCGIIMEQRRDRDFILQVVPLLGMFDVPAAVTEETLRTLAYTPGPQELMMTAQLSLGSVAYRLAAQAPERARKIIDEFMQHYGAAREQDEIGRVALVLGNAALEFSLPTLLAYSRDARPAVRAEGIAALRLFTAPEARAQVRQALRTDPDAAVRASAATSLGYMKLSPDMVSEMIGAFQSEADNQVRFEIFQSLWKSVREFPEVLAFARRIAADDSSEELRKAVRARLDSYRMP